MKESTLHILESLFTPESRHRIPIILKELECLLSGSNSNESLDSLLNLFEEQREYAEKLIQARYPEETIELDIKELLDVLSSNKRGLLNRVRVFQIRDEIAEDQKEDKKDKNLRGGSMKTLEMCTIAILVIMFSIQSAHADELPVAGQKMKISTSDFLPPHEVVMSLYRTDRAPREKKFLWLKPGRETSHFYKVLTKDGNEMIKESDHYITDPKPRDDRPLKERRPNVAIAVVTGQWAVAPLLGAILPVVAAKKN